METSVKPLTIKSHIIRNGSVSPTKPNITSHLSGNTPQKCYGMRHLPFMRPLYIRYHTDDYKVSTKSMLQRPHIINVYRKPQRCPICGSEVIPIIYGTGDMTEIEFLLTYKKNCIMGGDNIPRRPPIWACAAGCKRFRKINSDGTDAKVKIRLLKNEHIGHLQIEVVSEDGKTYVL